MPQNQLSIVDLVQGHSVSQAAHQPGRIHSCLHAHIRSGCTAVCSEVSTQAGCHWKPLASWWTACTHPQLKQVSVSAGGLQYCSMTRRCRLAWHPSFSRADLLSSEPVLLTFPIAILLQLGLYHKHLFGVIRWLWTCSTPRSIFWQQLQGIKHEQQVILKALCTTICHFDHWWL